MGERYPGDGAAANGFGRRHMHESKARLLYEADYQAPPDMRVPSSWRLSASGDPVPAPLSAPDRRAEITRIRSSLPMASRNLPRYAPNNNKLWTAYFERRHADQLAATNDDAPLGRFNSEGRRLWWDVPGRTLKAALEHIKGGNSPRLEYPTPLSFSRRRGNSWIVTNPRIPSQNMRSTYDATTCRSTFNLIFAYRMPPYPHGWSGMG